MCLKTKKCSIKNKKLKSVKGNILVTGSVFSLSNYNHFHNTLSLFDVLPNFSFTTRETMRVITYKRGIYKHGVYELSHELPNDLDLGSSCHGIFAARWAFIPIQEKKDFGSSEIWTHQASLKTP